MWHTTRWVCHREEARLRGSKVEEGVSPEKVDTRGRKKRKNTLLLQSTLFSAEGWTVQRQACRRVERCYAGSLGNGGSDEAGAPGRSSSDRRRSWRGRWVTQYAGWHTGTTLEEECSWQEDGKRRKRHPEMVAQDEFTKAELLSQTGTRNQQPGWVPTERRTRDRHSVELAEGGTRRRQHRKSSPKAGLGEWNRHRTITTKHRHLTWQIWGMLDIASGSPARTIPHIGGKVEGGYAGYRWSSRMDWRGTQRGNGQKLPPAQWSSPVLQGLEVVKD